MTGPRHEPSSPPPDGLLLALDTASPRVSVAVGRDGGCHAARSIEIRRSSESLLRLVDEALEEAGVRLEGLDGVIALRGPGSFTGLRVGLATLLGLHQASGVAATAVPTLRVLAFAGRSARPRAAEAGPVAAVVDALRGEWFTQLYAPDRRGEAAGAAPPLGRPEAVRPDALAARRPALVAGFGASRLLAAEGWIGDAAVWDPLEEQEKVEPAPANLAAAAIRLHREAPSAILWDPATLTAPLYLRAPAVSLPKRRRTPERPAADRT